MEEGSHTDEVLLSVAFYCGVVGGFLCILTGVTALVEFIQAETANGLLILAWSLIFGSMLCIGIALSRR